MQLVGNGGDGSQPKVGRGGAGQGGRAQVGEAEQVSWALGCAWAHRHARSGALRG